MSLALLLCAVALTIHHANGQKAAEEVNRDEMEIAHATLAKMPELYEFLLNRLALYHNLQYDLQDDKEPELLFYNLKDEVVQHYLVRDMTADQLSALLESLGFYKKSAKGEEVPKEFQHFPLKAPRDEL
ncbi:hypothetical protein chiPu_0006971 [Chiloscyllium punctatum]|uniref:Selenoprotein F/M domain-containing protein n=1 Tax=Chiloscyllium punctatum TaxID=137246 RepID=A0A401SDR9_CHIPU|nr:hypothetical protein [Chiloscyllium punctatum]